MNALWWELFELLPLVPCNHKLCTWKWDQASLLRWLVLYSLPRALLLLWETLMMLTRAFFFSFSDSEIDELEGPTVHYKPEAIETLCQLTKFNKRELQLMYRGFKQVSSRLRAFHYCPTLYWGPLRNCSSGHLTSHNVSCAFSLFSVFQKGFQLWFSQCSGSV